MTEPLIETGAEFIRWVLQTSWQATVVALLTLLTLRILGRRLPPRWAYALWFLLIVRLIMPVSLPSVTSVFNWTDSQFARASALVSHSGSLANEASAGTGVAFPVAEHIDHPSAPVIAVNGEPLQYVSSHNSAEGISESNLGPSESLAPSALAISEPAEQSAWKNLWFIAFTVWLLGAVVVGGRILGRELRLRGFFKTCVPVRDEALLQFLEECRRVMRLRERVILIETERIETPAVHGVRSRRLLLPASTIDELTRDELCHVVLHELAHIKRRDPEVAWLVTWLQVLHWFNPVLWLAFRRMRLDREMATDALVLSRLEKDQATGYGETILRMLERVTGNAVVPGTIGMGEEKAQLERRVRAIVAHWTGRFWRWPAVAAAGIVGAVALTDAVKDTPAAGTAEPTRAEVASDDIQTDPAEKGRVQVSGIRSMVLRAVEHETSERVAGLHLRVVVEKYGQPAEVKRLTTDATGEAKFEYGADALKRLAWVVEADDGWIGPEGEWLKQATRRIPPEVEVKVSRGVAIGGVVVGPDGNPVEGAEISFHHPVRFHLSPVVGGPDLTWIPGAERAIDTTDGNGRWSARALWPETRWAALRVRHAGFAEGTYSTEITEAMEAEGHGNRILLEELLKGEARLALRTGVSVRGKVVDATGKPIPGIEVRYSVQRPGIEFYDTIHPTRAVTTDPEGRFSVHNLEGTRVRFAVQVPGYAPVVGERALSGEPGELTLQLAPPVKLAGRVVDARSGEPLRGVQISLRDWGIWAGVRWDSVSDGDGRFQWPDAPAGKFQLRLERDGLIPQRNVIEPDDDRVIRMNPALRLSGKVVNAKTQEPVRNFRIIWAYDASMLLYRRRDAITGAGGRYLLDLGQLNEETIAGGYPAEFLFRLEAEGYAAFASRKFSSRQGDVGQIEYDVELQPEERVNLLVLGPDGQPVPGAQVALHGAMSRLRLAGKPRFEDVDGSEFPVTDSEGRVFVTPDNEATYVVAVHERGIAWQEAPRPGQRVTVRLQKWARIEGTAFANHEPLAEEKIHVDSRVLQSRPRPGWFPMLLVQFQVETDALGRFHADYLPPASCSLYRMIPNANGAASGPRETVEPGPGETALVTLGARGRPVIGRFVVKNPYVAVDWKRDHHWIQEEPPKAGPVEGFLAAQPELAPAPESLRNHPVRFAEDGSFRIDDVMPGRYAFWIRILDPRDPDALAYQRYIVDFRKSFEVPDLPGRDGKEPLNLGVFELSLKPRIEEGTTSAPEFSAVDLVGKPIALTEFKGKYVLLDFWATWCGPCVAELPYLRAVHEKFGKRNDFVLLSLSLDEKRETAKDFVDRSNMPWRHAYLGPADESDVPQSYGVSGIPATFLINPEGRIIATGIRGAEMASMLEEKLK